METANVFVVEIKMTSSRCKTSYEEDDFSRHLREISQAIAHRAYELFELNGSKDGYDLERWYNAESQFLQSVPVEFGETERRP